jgi:hypothetical protein
LRNFVSSGKANDTDAFANPVIGDQQDIALSLPGKTSCVHGFTRCRGMQSAGDALKRDRSTRAVLPYVQQASTKVNVDQLTDMTKCRLIDGWGMRNVTVLGCLRMNVLY